MKDYHADREITRLTDACGKGNVVAIENCLNKLATTLAEKIEKEKKEEQEEQEEDERAGAQAVASAQAGSSLAHSNLVAGKQPENAGEVSKAHGEKRARELIVDAIMSQSMSGELHHSDLIAGGKWGQLWSSPEGPDPKALPPAPPPSRRTSAAGPSSEAPGLASQWPRQDAQWPGRREWFLFLGRRRRGAAAPAAAPAAKEAASPSARS